MKIVHIVSEFAPLVKVGGMGDVLLGLARAQVDEGHHVEVILPRYSCIDHPMEKRETLSLEFDQEGVSCPIYQGMYDQIPLLFIDNAAYFDRPKIYGEDDDAVRFTFFCKAAAHLQRPADVIHLHDWHTASTPLFYTQPPPSVVTIHNLAYTGEISVQELQKAGIADTPIFQLEHSLSLLMGGLKACDHITTVSPTYAREICEEKSPFLPFFKQNRSKLTGILNGIDYTYWNPKNDRWLSSGFDQNTLLKRAEDKKALAHTLQFRDAKAPIVASIARLVPQKGPDHIERALHLTVERGGNFVLLGSAIDPEMAKRFQALQKKYASSGRVHIELGYHEKLAHQIYGGCDLFLVPSLFEPCGLTQLIAMRYGAIPLVRKTGGLADTVFDGVNGWSFEKTIDATLNRALDALGSPTWERLQKEGMQRDYSWKAPAAAYLKLYASLMDVKAL